VGIEFVADIAPSGASIIRSDDPSDGSTYLYTLLVPADANQLFPCFDQPDLKARVRLALTAPATWSVVANGPALSADTAGAGVTTRFAETPPISTYLIAFAAGPWAHAQASVEGRSITAYVRRSRAREADTRLRRRFSVRDVVARGKPSREPIGAECTAVSRARDTRCRKR